MSLIEKTRIDDIARSLFDTAIVPLARARRDGGQPDYYPKASDPAATTYFLPIDPAPLHGSAAIDFPGGGTPDGLIEALANTWTEQGELGLAALAPALREIAEALQSEHGQGNGEVDIYCYTMF